MTKFHNRLSDQTTGVFTWLPSFISFKEQNVGKLLL